MILLNLINAAIIYETRVYIFVKLVICSILYSLNLYTKYLASGSPVSRRADRWQLPYLFARF